MTAAHPIRVRKHIGEDTLEIPVDAASVVQYHRDDPVRDANRTLSRNDSAQRDRQAVIFARQSFE